MDFRVLPIQDIIAAPASFQGLTLWEAGNARAAAGPASSQQLQPQGAPGAQHLVTDFGKLLASAIDSLYGLHREADGLIQGLAAGEVSDLHQVMIAVEKANIALDLALQLRNKAIEAYQEIMRMQV
ncbi:MAG TPA: flagellar hook-basal body complex protein FliE [Firmicutes bacterium]|nr:flagellar hook-basal body complex protein FliE [Bacillota bacterium]